MFNQKVTLLLLTVAIAVVAGVGGGFAASRFFESTANAKGTETPGITREIIVPAEGLTFRTPDGKPLAQLLPNQGTPGTRNDFVIFNNAGKRAVTLYASPWGGDVSVFDNREAGAVVSMFAPLTGGGQLSINGEIKSALQLGAGKDGGVIVVYDGGGVPAMSLGVKAKRGSIEVLDDGNVIRSIP